MRPLHLRRSGSSSKETPCCGATDDREKESKMRNEKEEEIGFADAG